MNYTSLEDSGITLGALGIQQSWLSEHDDTSLIELEGYNCITQGKTSSSRGGLVIYLHEKYNYTCKHFNNSFELWENQFIEISGERVTKNIILGNIYRPPKTNIDSYSLFTEELTDILSSIEKSRSEVINAGDFNINLLDVMTADHVTKNCHALTSQSFQPLITLPTRFSATRGTLVDNIFCRNSETMLSSTSGILIDKFSDHQPYFTTINWRTYEKPPNYIQICKQTSADIDNFRIDLNKSNILENIDLNVDANPTSLLKL